MATSICWTRVSVLVLLVGIYLHSQSGRAQPSVTAAAAALQDDLFLAARTHYDRGEYIPAAEKFKKAYQLSKLPRLLQNIGAAYGKAARDLRLPLPERAEAAREAVAYLERFRSSLPALDTPHLAARRAEAEQLAVELSHRLQEANQANLQPEKKLHQKAWFRGLMIALGVAAGAGIAATAALSAPNNPQRPADATQISIMQALHRF